MKKMENSVERRIYSAGKTFLCFVAFLICIQPLLLCYFVVSVSRLLWRNFLIIKNQHLTFVKKDNLRTFSNTARNPGIVNIILHLQGEPNVEAIRDGIYQAVFQKNMKTGEFIFPKLSANLVTCWGFYAWKICPEAFAVDNHINVCKSSYRGRPVTSMNVQDYISNIVSKYLPVGLPPWQICVIPVIGPTSITSSTRPEDIVSAVANTSASGNDTEEEQPSSSDLGTRLTQIEHYYVVVRMHHLLISEEPNLRLCDLLAIDITSASTSTLNAHDELENDVQIPKSPLLDIMQYPVYIPQLYMRLQIGLTNAYNEFKSKYDPYVGKPSNSTTTSTSTSTSTSPTTSSQFPELNDPKLVHVETLPIETLPQLYASLFISYVTIASDFYKGFYATKHHPMIKMKFLNSLIDREVKKRNISWEVIWHAMWATLNPIRITKTSFEWICWAGVTVSILSPHLIYRELQAFRYCFFRGHAGYPDTFIGFMFAYIPLCYNAFKEWLQLIGIFVQAPRFIYEELIEIHRSDEHVLQNISLCGRKVLSWSKKISVNDVRRACAKHDLSPTELYMSANSATIMELLHEFETVPVPRQIRVFATLHHHDYLHGHLNNDDYESGHLSLILPMEKVSRKQVKQIRQNFKIARENQVGIYFLSQLHKRYNVLTKFLPAVWTVIIFNYLSRRFSITVTEIVMNRSLLQHKSKLSCWGHNVLDLLFFSPPQSNGSVSLSIQQFGDHIQLGVISDAQIHPLQMKVSEGWTKNLEKLL